MRTCAISWLLCLLFLRPGGGGELADEVTEMTSSGSQFLPRWGGRSDSEGEGRKRGVVDVRRGWMNDEPAVRG